MSLVNDANNMVMPVAPMYGNSGYSNGFGWGGDGSFWIIILFLFMMGNGGWGNGFGYGGSMMPWTMNNSTNSDVQRGFDQSALMSGLNGIQSSVTSGFGDVQNSLCSGFAGVNANINNGFAQSEIANNSRQMANMNQMFGLQTGLSNQLNTIAMNQQNCCCENRAAVADLKYTVATEACADRAAVNDGLRDLTAQGVSNTQALLNTINGGIQSIKDQLCQDKIDAKNETIANLRQELAMKDLAASQTAQTASLLSDNLRQTQTLEQYLNPAPIPAYMVQNPNCCSNNYGYGCGCNGLA